METKPIVTTHGNQVVFSSLQKSLLEGLPKEAAEWRRSYGRPARNVFLEASFVPYDDDILPDDTDKTLISRPYFHIFWTDCDLESYKQEVKEEINDWCTALKAKDISDWMIVVVNSDDNKAKTKLLPRSSLYDKIKSDFCSKQPERIVLLDYQRSENKTHELWNTFLSRLRQLLLQAFTRHLQKYEDNMRALREKRNDVGWNFQQYFIVQEELAFMFEMLGLYDDAMIQYDELDALFTQFVLNHASGRLQDIVKQYKANASLSAEVDPLILQQLTSKRCINLEIVPWLSSFVKPCKSWAGLSLKKAIAWDKRNLIKDNQAPLLEFRNYLFSRQCALLFLMKRTGEIIQRAIDYLHETVQEMKTLNIEIGEGCLDCWVFLSGLEVLQHCENLVDASNPRAQALNTAYLWDYVCRKLHKLGDLCGLMPGSAGPTSDQLTLILDLTSGMGLHISEEPEQEDITKISPRDRLREALSSKESFQRICLEQSELAMGTFKYVGRFRSARMIGKNLADFYMKLGEAQKAENYLLDAMTSYHQEGWKKLRDVTRLELAKCQFIVADHHKYVKTACQVAGSSLLDTDSRTCHMLQVLDIAATTKVGPILLKASPLLKIEVSCISKVTVAVDEAFSITMIIESHSPCDLSCDSIWLTLTDYMPDSKNEENTSIESLKSPVCRQTSNSSLDNRYVMNLSTVKKQIPATLNLHYYYEGSIDEPVSIGITCVNPHEVLNRKDSISTVSKKEDENVTKDTYSKSVTVKNVVLKEGKNIIEFICEGIAPGHYMPGQTGVQIDHVELIKDMTSDLTVLVKCEEAFCKITSDELISGLKQEVTIDFHTGGTLINAGGKVHILSVDDLSIETNYENNTVILQGIVKGGTATWKMEVLKEPDVLAGDTIESKVAFDCSWLPRPIITTLTFKNPFHVSHKIHTAREMKYIQVIVNGLCETEFVLTHWTLKATNTKHVDFVCLNQQGQSMKVNIDQSLCCVWQVKTNTSEIPAMELCFTVLYRSLNDDTMEPKIIKYNFSLTNIQTWFTVKVDVMPCGDNKVCKTGTLSLLKFHIIKMPVNNRLNQDLMYEITGKNWNVHGKSAGVFSIAGSSYTTVVEVLPLMHGFLPLPRIKLYKYNAAISTDIWLKKSKVDKDENLDSTDDEHSDTDQPSYTEFEQGQVYYSSLGKQVHVYPAESNSQIEVSLV